MTISKSRRFDLFKRDGFTCQYCGQRPPDVVLEIDHIEPRSKGGTDDAINLITSCYDCNRGKAAKRLGQVSPRPDADIEFLAIQQESAEVRRYLRAKEERDKLIDMVIQALFELWASEIDPDKAPPDHQFKRWLTKYSPDQIDAAIRKAGPKWHSGYIKWGLTGAILYVSGILKREAEDE